MIKFLRQIIWYSIPILLCIIGYESIVRKAGNEYDYKNRWLTEHANSVQILVLGSSHTYCGIDPEHFSLKAFNAAHPGQDLYYDDFIFNKFYEQFDSLEYVIVPVSYIFAIAHIEDTPNRNLVKNYVIYYDCPNHPYSIKYHLESYWGINVSLLKQVISGKQYSLKCSELGMETDFSTENIITNLEASGQYEAKLHSYTTHFGACSEEVINEGYHKCLDYVRDIIIKCSDRRINVILLTTPTYHTYWMNLDKEQLQMTYKFCEQILSEFTNVSYLNMLQDERFTESDFFNADHLNRHGAEKLSKILNEYIENHEQLIQ